MDRFYCFRSRSLLPRSLLERPFSRLPSGEKDAQEPNRVPQILEIKHLDRSLMEHDRYAQPHDGGPGRQTGVADGSPIGSSRTVSPKRANSSEKPGAALASMAIPLPRRDKSPVVSKFMISKTKTSSTVNRSRIRSIPLRPKCSCVTKATVNVPSIADSGRLVSTDNNAAAPTRSARTVRTHGRQPEC